MTLSTIQPPRTTEWTTALPSRIRPSSTMSPHTTHTTGQKTALSLRTDPSTQASSSSTSRDSTEKTKNQIYSLLSQAFPTDDSSTAKQELHRVKEAIYSFVFGVLDPNSRYNKYSENLTQQLCQHWVKKIVPIINGRTLPVEIMIDRLNSSTTITIQIEDQQTEDCHRSTLHHFIFTPSAEKSSEFQGSYTPMVRQEVNSNSKSHHSSLCPPNSYQHLHLERPDLFATPPQLSITPSASRKPSESRTCMLPRKEMTSLNMLPLRQIPSIKGPDGEPIVLNFIDCLGFFSPIFLALEKIHALDYVHTTPDLDHIICTVNLTQEPPLHFLLDLKRLSHMSRENNPTSDIMIAMSALAKLLGLTPQQIRQMRSLVHHNLQQSIDEIVDLHRENCDFRIADAECRLLKEFLLLFQNVSQRVNTLSTPPFACTGFTNEYFQNLAKQGRGITAGAVYEGLQAILQIPCIATTLANTSSNRQSSIREADAGEGSSTQRSNPSKIPAFSDLLLQALAQDYYTHGYMNSSLLQVANQIEKYVKQIFSAHHRDEREKMCTAFSNENTIDIPPASSSATTPIRFSLNPHNANQVDVKILDEHILIGEGHANRVHPYHHFSCLSSESSKNPDDEVQITYTPLVLRIQKKKGLFNLTTAIERHQQVCKTFPNAAIIPPMELEKELSEARSEQLYQLPRKAISLDKVMPHDLVPGEYFADGNARQLGLVEILELYLPILAALRDIHSMGFIHCSPHERNVMLDIDPKTGTMKSVLIDFDKIQEISDRTSKPGYTPLNYVSNTDLLIMMNSLATLFGITNKLLQEHVYTDPKQVQQIILNAKRNHATKWQRKRKQQDSNFAKEQALLEKFIGIMVELLKANDKLKEKDSEMRKHSSFTSKQFYTLFQEWAKQGFGMTAEILHKKLSELLDEINNSEYSPVSSAILRGSDRATLFY